MFCYLYSLSVETLFSFNSILFDEVAEEDRKLCIQLLQNVETLHTKLALEVKNKGIKEVFDVDIDGDMNFCKE
jgi:hypothetical protein